jgi:hypothetical protein
LARIKVLITVVTYPLPSRSYDELVCTTGILESGEWIRIYPVPLSFLIGKRKDGQLETFKYNWVELDLVKRTDDFRPESHSPQNYDFRDFIQIKKIDTKDNWRIRKEFCLRKVCTNLTDLIELSKEPYNQSLATFKPTKILSFEIEPEKDREWKDEWKELRKQGDLFDQEKSPEIQIRKLPYKFYYRFTDDEGKESRLMIEDWEIGALYWNCLKKAEGDEKLALEKVSQTYKSEFLKQKDIYLFLGTTKEWHMRRARNPFVIIGVFYPKKEVQLRLF